MADSITWLDEQETTDSHSFVVSRTHPVAAVDSGSAIETDREDNMAASIQLDRFDSKADVCEGDFAATIDSVERAGTPDLSGLERRETAKTETNERLLTLRHTTMGLIAAAPADRVMGS